MVHDIQAPPRDPRGGVAASAASGGAPADDHAARSSFLAHVSHELRTPLTLITAPLEDALAHPDLPPELRRHLALVQRGAARLTRMVDAMLDFGRIEAGALEPAPVDLDVAAMLRTLVEFFVPTMERAGLSLVTDIEDLPRAAHLDHDMVERIVSNLLANAIKYTPRGTISIALRDLGESLSISVTDTGVGIAAADRERVFHRFERVATPMGARSPGGVGIGLPMVRDLATILGGQVTLESTPGVGSTFTVTLPYTVGDPTGTHASITPRGAASFVAEMASWRGIAPDTRRPPTGHGRAALLVVEDNPDIADYLSSVLADSYDVTVAVDGAAALECLDTGRVDIVLADAVLPRLDGHELVAAMRADPRFSDVPVVLVSAQASWSDVAEGLTGGADDYLAKPFSLAELRARLATHLGRAMDRITTAEAFEERQAHLQRALEGHRVVGQAIGILVERHRITASQAFDLLRDASQHRNIKMRDIAQRVIETGLDPDQA